MNVNEILITISQSSILITEITYKNTLGSTLKNNERTHLPLVNMDWANCRIKPHHRSTGGGRSTQRSVFPARLWTALRVQVSSSPLSARSWLVDGSSATPALAFGVFLSLFHVFPRSWAFASFLGPYFMGKIWIFRTTYCVATLGSVSLVSSSTRVLDLYMLWGIQSENRRIPARSSVAIARSSDGASRMTARESPDRRQAWALYRHRRISVR